MFKTDNGVEGEVHEDTISDDGVKRYCRGREREEEGAIREGNYCGREER